MTIVLLGMCGIPQFALVRAQSVSENQKPDPAGYVLQPGDVIDIKVFNVPELHETVNIRPDGRISVQLLNDIVAAGLTISKLTEILTAAYSPFYRDPKVGINVMTFANLKVYVGGEVERSGMYPLVGDMTAMRAVLQAGGLKTTARPEDALLLRNSGRNTLLSIKLNLKDVLRNGKPDTPLQPFDVVFVPKSKIARVDDFVNQYIRQVIPVSLSIGFSYLFNNPFPTDR